MPEETQKPRPTGDRPYDDTYRYQLDRGACLRARVSIWGRGFNKQRDPSRLFDSENFHYAVGFACRFHEVLACARGFRSQKLSGKNARKFLYKRGFYSLPSKSECLSALCVFVFNCKIITSYKSAVLTAIGISDYHMHWYY